MNLDRAKKLITACAEEMDARYQRPVFDEWAIINLSLNRGLLLDYFGPRREGFKTNFGEDARCLRAGLMGKEQNPGDYEFTRYGAGSAFESFMALGPGVFLICNNMVQTMDAIAQNPLWLQAQVSFVQLLRSLLDRLHAEACIELRPWQKLTDAH